MPDRFPALLPVIQRPVINVHTDELIRCVRAHGMTRADWVIPRGLDRYGLRLLVFTTDGTSAVRLPQENFISAKDIDPSLAPWEQAA